MEGNVSLFRNLFLFSTLVSMARLPIPKCLLQPKSDYQGRRQR